GEGEEIGELRPTRGRGGDEQQQERGAAGEPMQQAEPEGAPGVTARVRVLVRDAVNMTVEMEVGLSALAVGVHVEMPPPARIAPQHRSTETDQQQAHEKVGRRGEACGQGQPEQDIALTTTPTRMVWPRAPGRRRPPAPSSTPWRVGDLASG